MRLLGKFLVFLFFLRKILSVQKASKPKTKDYLTLDVFVRKKMLVLLFFVRLFLFC